ncbi:MAG: biotin-dependent carboxyltransferase family protein [Coprothermobacterota bacterium]|nr:biotin-dependent carboxyltransferase family protein [Coprothermobacterota bacterium]
MILLRAHRPGFLSTIQDLGRPGYLKEGLPPSGALDEPAFLAANLLVGNPIEAAALELTLWGGEWECLAGGWAAIAGADMKGRLNGEPIGNWRSLQLSRGDRLELGSCRNGCRTYFALEGGIEGTLVLGSRSTYLRAGLGGLQGRAIQSGDLLLARTKQERGEQSSQLWEEEQPGQQKVPRALEQSSIPNYPDPCILRVLWGPQEERFPAELRAVFSSSAYRVSERHDRMGVRLEGSSLAPPKGSDLLSQAIPPGAVQIPPDGQPMVMLADRQTTGGYAVIATVLGADLWKAGQMKAGDVVRFHPVPLEEARTAWRDFRAYLSQLPIHFYSL